jgi:hypothetical protein
MFDMAHLISVRGTVTDFQWANPHRNDLCLRTGPEGQRKKMEHRTERKSQGSGQGGLEQRHYQIRRQAYLSWPSGQGWLQQYASR